MRVRHDRAVRDVRGQHLAPVRRTPYQIETEVHDDPLQPRLDRAPAAETTGSAHRAEECLLHDVARVVGIAGQPSREYPHPRTVPSGELGERRSVPLDVRSDEFLVAPATDSGTEIVDHVSPQDRLCVPPPTPAREHHDDGGQLMFTGCACGSR
ncbi:hypothetical protein Ae168Ps1_2912 [Pseudonocardia sp. Ae168_Ps1]|nr:hypothetical protein Ae168Ps1_2912 [Pseudonocardia sp. Ae168_Ps1]OLL85366.1 hypothetical protein Ae263Ps1_2421c [Pseudonocardia sp. Ae263_Ps1]OLL94607.1 hypothetical protein Ae356Ps1_4504 [Pseudonocardia sp. Ae356_Ps1]